MAAKARPEDARPGATLWLRDHGTWVPVVVEALAPGGKDWKVTFRRPDGTLGKHALDAVYRTSPAPPAGVREMEPGGEDPRPGGVAGPAGQAADRV
jgi:hypothetical protein